MGHHFTFSLSVNKTDVTELDIDWGMWHLKTEEKWWSRFRDYATHLGMLTKVDNDAVENSSRKNNALNSEKKFAFFFFMKCECMIMSHLYTIPGLRIQNKKSRIYGSSFLGILTIDLLFYCFLLNNYHVCSFKWLHLPVNFTNVSMNN